MSGYLVAFEGIDGSGKSTQAGRLAERLRREGKAVTRTREPGGTELGRAIRRLLLDAPGAGDVEPLAELFLFAADRAQHVASVVRPGLDAGRIVISDRFCGSTLAYQGYGRGLDRADLKRLERLATSGIAPDLTVVVDIDVRTSRERKGWRSGDRVEGGCDSFFERVRQGYLEMAKADPVRSICVDGRLPIGELSDRIYAEVGRRLDDPKGAR